jgi:tryptophan synthase alpha subunit
MLEEMLAALAVMARQKMPDDEEIAAVARAATTIIMGSALQEMIAEQLRKPIGT